MDEQRALLDELMGANRNQDNPDVSKSAGAGTYASMHACTQVQPPLVHRSWPRSPAIPYPRTHAQALIEDYRDRRVCKHFLLGCCPHDVFRQTKIDMVRPLVPAMAAAVPAVAVGRSTDRLTPHTNEYRAPARWRTTTSSRPSSRRRWRTAPGRGTTTTTSATWSR